MEQINEIIGNIEVAAALSRDENFNQLYITFVRERSRRIQIGEDEKINNNNDQQNPKKDLNKIL